jgi:hypothetical protein
MVQCPELNGIATLGPAKAGPALKVVFLKALLIGSPAHLHGIKIPRAFIRVKEALPPKLTLQILSAVAA